MKKNKIKKARPDSFLGKVWYFIWEDDSPLSWIVNILLAYVFIKFLIYPGLGLLFGTTHPVVAVVSGSMEHGLANGIICGVVPADYNSNFDGFWKTCGDFYSEFNITKDDFYKYSFRNGFNTGDIIVLFGKKPESLNPGDVIVFQGNRPDPIIHRIVKKWSDNGKYYFQTKGDHNPMSDPSETKINQERVIGKAVFRIPFLGYIKIWFVELLKFIGIYKYIPI
ncbi:MAG: signal peptidase I [archaeon]